MTKPMTENTTDRAKPVVLCILDGWGSRSDAENNAIILGQTPNFDRMTETCPMAYLQTSGLQVGLPDGQMGNSEVGHTNLGGGRVVLQDLPRINKSIADGNFPHIGPLKTLIAQLKLTGGTCHLLGLLSPGGVHSHQDHIVALSQALSQAGIPVAIHAFLDGRDVPPRSAVGFMTEFEQDISLLKGVRVATVSGRYYAMDRDNRWDRVERAYRTIAEATGEQAEQALNAIEDGYKNDLTDEFILPTVIGNFDGMKDGDALVMANFRADRAREIVTSFVDPNFDSFPRKHPLKFCCRLGMSEYSEALTEFMDVMFPSDKLADTLGEVISQNGLTQLRIAETEKYAHVTFFFNGGSEGVFPGEDRILIPSPNVATYDLQPEMSAPEVTEKLVTAITSGKYDLIVVNFANPDMVGHTGIMSAAKIAVETVDNSLGQLERALTQVGGTMLVTADHGNIETMKDLTSGQPHTAHTTNLVPFILVNGAAASYLLADGGEFSLNDGCLADVAPTILSLMRLDKPQAMTGHSLLNTGDQATA